jgi:Cystatin domain
LEVLEKAVKLHNEADDTTNPLTVDNVVSIYVQVVAGLKYDFTVVCTEAGVKQPHRFLVWDHFGEITLLSHEKKVGPLHGDRTKHAGGWKAVDPSDERVPRILDFAFAEMNKDATERSKLSLVHVESVETQVVAGVNWHFVLSVVVGDDKDIVMSLEARVFDHFGDLELTSHVLHR